MLSRFLEKRIIIEGQEIPGDPGNVIELEYYLLESNQDSEKTASQGISYGMQIIKKGCGMANESIMFKDIHPSRKTTEKLVELMAQNTVTPVTLPYIMDDLLGFEI